MDFTVDRLQDKKWYGLVVVLILLVLFLVQVGSWVHLGSVKEGYDGQSAGYTPAMGGPKGASYHALNTHTGSTGDHNAYDRFNYSDEDLLVVQPELIMDAPESFLNSRFPGPAFAENTARMVTGLTAPLYAKARSHEQQLAGLTHAVNPNEIVQGGTESYMTPECNHDPYSEPSYQQPGGACGGSHSHDPTTEHGLYLSLGN